MTSILELHAGRTERHGAVDRARDGRPLYVDTLALAKADKRREFFKGPDAAVPDLDAIQVEEQLLTVAAELASNRQRSPPTSARSPSWTFR